LNAEAVRLLAAIIRNSRHKPRGSRWNFEDKILALSLLKRSPKSYILLQTLFPLPSGRTLQSLLNTVHFRTGLNTHVFDALRHSVQKMSEIDRYCCLLFDEMSIRENVRFNQKFDCIEDHGSHGRKYNIANHALLFMVRGLHRKWYSLVVQANKQVTDGGKQEEGYKEEDENPVTHVRQSKSNASLFSRIKMYMFKYMISVIYLCYPL
jgi:hypothetical protein